MLDDINELRTFVSVVAAQSLSAAARELDLALSVVSKRLAALERRTGTSLITRSTRHLALTEEGRDLYERALRILAEVDEAEAALRAVGLTHDERFAQHADRTVHLFDGRVVEDSRIAA